MSTNIHYIDQSSITLPNGFTIKRGDIVEYFTGRFGCFRYFAVIEDWSKSGKTLTIRSVVPKWDADRNIKSVRARDGKRNTLTLRHEADRGDYRSSEFADAVILFSEGNPIIKLNA
jgi:hypothetical protein